MIPNTYYLRINAPLEIFQIFKFFRFIVFLNYRKKKGFIKTTYHRPTAHQITESLTTSHVPTDPPTIYPPTHRLAIINLHQNRKPDSENVLLNVFYNS